MAKPRDVVVRFLADTRDFLRGTDNVEDAFRDMARGEDRVADEAEDSARRIARAYDKAADKVRRDSKGASKATREAYADAGREAGDEFAQNLGESLSSGDVSGLLSGTIGGLVGTFGKGGPLALALGALGAVGVGVFQAIAAQAEQAAAAAQQAFDDIRDGATDAAKVDAFLTDRFGSTVKGWEAIARYSEASGTSVEAIADAIANGGSKARVLADQWDAILRAQYETEGTIDRTNSALVDGVDDLRDRADASERAARAAQTERDARGETYRYLKDSARYYAQAYGAGSSTYQSQVPRYTGGKRS
jgi:hypothetical protein